MAPGTSRASLNCCTGREPPSPEGSAPRPTSSSAISVIKQISVEHGCSWTSADVNELQAIFEDELQADAKTNSIKLNKFRGDIDDSLERQPSESEGDPELTNPKKSSHTLKAVTEKLKKHLSIDSALAKRHSRSSIGTTDEEVERRAELRRIRQRRIQEELSNESIYDDDAKSLSSLLGTVSNRDTKTPVPHLPAALIPLVDLTPSRLPYPGLVLHELGPTTKADTDSPTVKSYEVVTDSGNMSTTLVNSNESIDQNHNSQLLSEPYPNEYSPKVYVPSRKASSFLETPAAPILEATRPPSDVEPGTLKSPWRLSFSSENRSEGLRKLSQGNIIPMKVYIEKETTVTSILSPRPSTRGHQRQAVDIAANPEIENNIEATGSHLQTCCGSMDFGGVDGTGDESAFRNLHTMDISQRLASRGLQSSVSSPQLSIWGSHPQENSISSSKVTEDHSRRMRHTEDLVASIDRSLIVWDEIKLDTSSLRSRSAAAATYPQAEKSRISLLSFLPRSRTRSKFNLTVVANREEEECGGREEQQILEDRRISSELPGLTTILSETSDREVESSKPTATLSLSTGPLAQDDTSFVPSEASSFREREEELETLQLRFAERRVLSTPVSSKFREEFDKPALPIRKLSVLARLARLARRSYDAKAKTLIKKRRKACSEGRRATVGGKKKGRGLFGKKQKDAELSAAEQYQQQFEERMAVKELVMDSWEMEMEATAAKAKTKSRNIVRRIKPTAPDFRFPASWARFPSHDRQERVSSATALEKIEVKDFANLGMQENGDILWCLAHDDAGHHTVIDGLHRKKALGERFIQAVEKELYEFDTQDDQRAQTNGRRGSLTVSCELEYPELEILPVTLMGQEEMLKHEEKKEEFQTAIAKDEELDEIARLLGGGFDGVMSRACDAGAGAALNSAGASDWEDEMVMSSSDEKESKPHLETSDPSYYADCVLITKSTFASPVGTPGGTLALRTDVLEELIRLPKDENAIELDFSWNGNGKERAKCRGISSGEDWGGHRFEGQAGNGEVNGKERKGSLGTLLLSKSVSDQDLVGELARREEEVRCSLLKAVEDAFGMGGE